MMLRMRMRLNSSAAPHLRGAGEGSWVSGQALAAGLQSATLVGQTGAGGAGGQASGASHPGGGQDKVTGVGAIDRQFPSLPPGGGGRRLMRLVS